MLAYKKKLIKLFVPFMLSQVLGIIQLLIDRIFVGHYSEVVNGVEITGRTFMEAIGNATAPLWTTLNFVFSLAMGASILVSHAVGSKEIDRAKEFEAAILKFHNIISIVLFILWFFFSKFVYQLMGVPEGIIDYCVQYSKYYSPIFLLVGAGAALMIMFQTSNYTKPLILYGLLRSGLNVLLDYLLIFGNWGFPQLGVCGAALATTIAEFTAALYALVYVIFTKKLLTKPSLKQILHVPFRPYFKELKLGIPASAEDFACNFTSIMIMVILNRISESAMNDPVRQAAAGIYTTVLTLQILIGGIVGSVGSATMTLTGEATGSKDLPLFRSIVKTAFIWSISFCALILVIVSCVPKQILEFMTDDKLIISSSAIYLILIACNMFSRSGNLIFGNGIRGFGDTKWMFYIQLFGTVFVVAVAWLLVFQFGLGLTGVFVALMVDEFVRMSINLIRLLKIKFS